MNGKCRFRMIIFLMAISLVIYVAALSQGDSKTPAPTPTKKALTISNEKEEVKPSPPPPSAPIAIQTPASKTIPLSGSVEMSGGEILKCESGWAFFVKPGDIVKLLVEQSEKPSGETEIEVSPLPDASGIYLMKQGRALRWEVSGGAIQKFLPGGIIWKAPGAPGSHKISVYVTEETSCSSIAPEQKTMKDLNLAGTFVFHLLVMYPFDREGSGVIEGYPIGLYPNEKAENVREPVLSHRDAYSPPQYFIKVTPENASAPISRHFTLGNFSPASDKGKVNFIALNPSLVKRLEDLISALQEKGVKVTTLTILRGFMTPNQVELLRRKGLEIAQFTRTIYGDSAIFIIDENNDGIMDDLTGDGKVDQEDFEVIAGIMTRLEDGAKLFGGLGFSKNFKDPGYRDTPNIQIDTRGWRTRWTEE